MDLVDPILFIVEKLYALCGEVKANKKRWQRLAYRVRALDKVVRAVRVEGLGKEPEVVERGLQELRCTLEAALEVGKKYTSAHFLSRIARAYDMGEEFEMLNARLNDHFQVLSLALQADQRETLAAIFTESRLQAEDRADRERDRKDLEMMAEQVGAIKEGVDAVLDGVDSVKTDVQDIKVMLKYLRSPSLQLQDIKEIKLTELEIEETPIITSPTHELYKGQYNKFAVAIKRYTYTANTTPSEVREVFKREVETMKRFESPNILRMFGICVEDEHGPSPNYLIIMEFCEKGSLQEVLSGKDKLSWRRRARMSLDAAQGLYRLHQSEEKFKVHGSICSAKFLVDDGYRVKLACFELAKTETSLRRNKSGINSSIHYCSPQQLQSIHHPYNKACEIYSFGIVLWEIATRQTPFRDMSENEVYVKVSKEKYKEPLPEDCPGSFVKLIDTCRSYEAFHRPSAGVLVDKLRKVVQEMDED